MSTEVLYDTLGVGYTRTRRPDPRIERAIHACLGDAKTVINVGAGAGSYEPRDRQVTAVEPSAVMRAQRPQGLPPAIVALAEALPFEDGAFDASMAVLTDHHWPDRARGLRELRRVARKRTVLFTHDLSVAEDSWLTRDYFPELRELQSMPLADIARHLGATRIVAVPVPHDCVDGFLFAFWQRPEAYLGDEVREGISWFRMLDDARIQRFVDALRDDLASGAWRRRNGWVDGESEMDFGYRLLVAGDVA